MWMCLAALCDYSPVLHGSASAGVSCKGLCALEFCCRWWALVLVFFVSAVGHEVVVGVPLHMLRGWAFWGIMMQVRPGFVAGLGSELHCAMPDSSFSS